MRGSTRLTKPFSGRIIVFDLQVHDGADPGESVGIECETLEFDLRKLTRNSPVSACSCVNRSGKEAVHLSITAFAEP